jgi:hypothetical protein
MGFTNMYCIKWSKAYMDMLKNFIMCENSLASGFYIFLSALN